MASTPTINDDFTGERLRDYSGGHAPRTHLEHTLASLDEQALTRVASTHIASSGVGEGVGTSSGKKRLLPATSTINYNAWAHASDQHYSSHPHDYDYEDEDEDEDEDEEHAYMEADRTFRPTFLDENEGSHMWHMLFPASSTRPHEDKNEDKNEDEDKDKDHVHTEAHQTLLPQSLATAGVAAQTLPHGGGVGGGGKGGGGKGGGFGGGGAGGGGVGGGGNGGGGRGGGFGGGGAGGGGVGGGGKGGGGRGGGVGGGGAGGGGVGGGKGGGGRGGGFGGGGAGGSVAAAEDRRPAIAGPASKDDVRRLLELNRQMQRLIQEQLALVDDSLYCNRMASGTTSELSQTPSALAPAPGAARRETRELGASAFGVGDSVPSASRDAKTAAALRQLVPYSTDISSRPYRWTSNDRHKLRSAVALAVLSVRHRSLLLRAQDHGLSDASRQDARERVRALPTDAEALGDGELCQLLNDAPPLDWFELARTHLPSRSAAECEAHWMHVDDPRARPFPSAHAMLQKVHKVPFSEAEQLDLERLAKEHGGHAWDDVARRMSELGHPGRGPMACFRYYKTVILPRRVESRKAWTHEEDELLGMAVGQVGDTNWQRVAELMNWVATPEQCLQHWRYSLDPSLRKGEWASAEDELLRQAVARSLHPTTGKVRSWKDVGNEMPNRTSMQCRERWCNRLDPSLRIGTEWAADEDARLLGAVEVLGQRWAAVKRHASLDGRTDKMAKQRWVQLTRAPPTPRQPRQRQPRPP